MAIPYTQPSKQPDEDTGVSLLSTTLEDYLREIEPTDRLPPDRLEPVLMGLFGEVGGILAALKKRVREPASYSYDEIVEEEFGDTLWYFAALCRRLSIPMESVVGHASDQEMRSAPLEKPGLPSARENRGPRLATTYLELGKTAAALLRISIPDDGVIGLLREFWTCYLAALQVSGLKLHVVAMRNLRKARGRFLKPDPSSLPTFDGDFPADERLPEHFEITIRQRPSGQTNLQWNGVFIGDPLTDNIADSDGYRYHDVFHLAHASILHWSPTFRSLIKHKRKTVPHVDEAQDGGRAIVVEEGLTAWVFSRAKQLGYFECHSNVSFDVLKTVQQFVQGYEVDECPLNLWERAILQGYEVFRQVRDNDGGIIVGDRRTRKIAYRPLADDGS